MQVIHWGVVESTPQRRSRRPLCSPSRGALDEVVEQPGLELRPLRDEELLVNCEACQALFTEAILLETRFLPCPTCGGLGNAHKTQEVPSTITFNSVIACQKCRCTGLVLAGHGGRDPLPGYPW